MKNKKGMIIESEKNQKNVKGQTVNFYFPAWQKILVGIYKTRHLSQLSLQKRLRKIAYGVSYTHYLMKKLEENKFIQTEIEGRKRLMELTKKGLKAVEYITELNKLIEKETE